MSKLHKVRVKQISLFRLFQFSEALYIRVGPRKVNLIGATCSLTPMWVMVIECLWNTFWPDPSKDLRFRKL